MTLSGSDIFEEPRTPRPGCCVAPVGVAGVGEEAPRIQGASSVGWRGLGPEVAGIRIGEELGVLELGGALSPDGEDKDGSITSFLSGGEDGTGVPFLIYTGCLFPNPPLSLLEPTLGWTSLRETSLK